MTASCGCPSHLLQNGQMTASCGCPSHLLQNGLIAGSCRSPSNLVRNSFWFPGARILRMAEPSFEKLLIQETENPNGNSEQKS
jgi:hypothetical protein